MLKQVLAGIFVAAMSLGASSVDANSARDVAQLTNAYRANHGLPPLKVSSLLERVAAKHGKDMYRHGYFSHKGSDGSRVSQRAWRSGYRYCYIAENIAMGHRSPNEVLKGWINSRPHRKTLLTKNAAEIGVIREKGDIWVMVVGQPGC